MPKMTKEEKQIFKKMLDDIDLIGAKQALLGILAVIVFKERISRSEIKEIIEDAKKLTFVLEEKNGMSV